MLDIGICIAASNVFAHVRELGWVFSSASSLLGALNERYSKVAEELSMLETRLAKSGGSEKYILFYFTGYLRSVIRIREQKMVADCGQTLHCLPMVFCSGYGGEMWWRQYALPYIRKYPEETACFAVVESDIRGYDPKGSREYKPVEAHYTEAEGPEPYTRPERIMESLLKDDEWGEYGALIAGLREWELFSLFADCLTGLRRELLFTSRVHGEGHIERVMLHGAFSARDNGLSVDDARLLLIACSYHDVGRKSDGYEPNHGYESTLRISGRMIGLEDPEELKIVLAAVEAHSRPDRDMEEILRAHKPADWERTKNIAELLKDCDGLDRVRLGDWALNTSYLRRNSAKGYVPFSLFLYRIYRTVEAGATVS